MTTTAPTVTHGTIEDRLSLAVARWQDAHPGQTTSSIMGTGAIKELEMWFTKHVDHFAGFAVGSGTQALIAALAAVGIGRDSLVALPAYDWTAALAATLAVGAEPIWCDVGPNGVVTPLTVQKLGRSPDLIVATSLHGYAVDVAGIRSVMPGTPIVEDCSQALGALRDGTPSGTHADVAIWSIGHGKHLDAGEGGLITTRHERVAAEILRITQHPLRQALSSTTPDHLAWITRMHPAAAILAVAQLDSIDSRLSIDREEYRKKFLQARQQGIDLPDVEATVNASPGTLVAFERNGRRGPGYHILQSIYPISPPSLVSQPCPPMARLWTLCGRPVAFDAVP